MKRGQILVQTGFCCAISFSPFPRRSPLTRSSLSPRSCIRDPVLWLQGLEEETYWLLRSLDSDRTKPRLTSTDSRLSIVSGVSLGNEVPSEHVEEDEVSNIPARSTFRTTRIMMGVAPRADVMTLQQPIKRPIVMPSTSGESVTSSLHEPRGSVTSLGDDVMFAKDPTSSTTTTVAELHRVDSIGSTESLNMRI